MANAGQTAAPIASTGLGLALPFLTGLAAGPAGAIAGGVGALISLVSSIGQGRKDANQMTENGGPQDILNKQLAAISSSGQSPQAVAQATQLAWTQFLQAANQFAAKGPEYAQVAKQAIFQTPALTNTVQSLLGGANPLGSQYTGLLSSAIPGATPQSGISLGSLIGSVAGGFGGAFAGSGLANAGGAAAGAGGGVASVPGEAGAGGIDLTGGGIDPTTGQPWNVGGGSFGGPYATNPTMSMPNGPGPVNAGGGGIGSFLNNLFGTGGKGGSLGGGLLQGGLSLINGILGGNAATKAAGLQAGAANNAANLEAQAAANSLAFAQQVYGNQQAANAPYLAAGQNALGQIQSLIAPGGALSTPFTPPPGAPPTTFNALTYTLPTAAQVEQTPGYQLELSEAMKALGVATRGVTNANSIKAATEFGTNYAGTQYNNSVQQGLAAYNANEGAQLGAFNASQGAYNTSLNNALNIFQTNRANTLNPLLTLAGFGQNAVQTNAQTGNNAVQTTAGIQIPTAQNIGNLGQQGAAATAQGGITSTNSLTAALQQLINQAQLRQLLSQSSYGSGAPTTG
jgi:hypothetical protein